MKEVYLRLYTGRMLNIPGRICNKFNTPIEYREIRNLVEYTISDNLDFAYIIGYEFQQLKEKVNSVLNLKHEVSKLNITAAKKQI